MRQGANPAKASTLAPFKRHRVIVPVYVPSSDGYFRHAAEVLSLCLESLSLTTRGRASITVVANGCTPDIVEHLQAEFEAGRIHQLVLNRRNWGKIDAALSMLRGRFEDLLTVADADVLFQPGWLEAVERVFRAFPECGVVTPSPNPSLAFAHTTATLLSAWRRRELRYQGVVPEHDLDRFATSIGRPDYLQPMQRHVQLTVTRDGQTACVGGGHFVFTMRREVAWQLPSDPSTTALRPFGESKWFDDPPDAMGYWRLSTPRAYAYHMGNVPEDWMREALDACRQTVAPAPAADQPLPAAAPSAWRRVPLRWRQSLVRLARKGHFEKRWAREALAARVHA
ncbi:MAG: glycosyltransferase family A protein [Vicinamibacterales bacterium]